MKSKTSHPDHVDRTFSDYFQSQVPNPWPECPAPQSSVPLQNPIHTSRGSAWYSRSALAFSVVLLLGLGFLLTSSNLPPTPNATKNGLTEGATASGKNIFKNLDPMKSDPPSSK